MTPARRITVVLLLGAALACSSGDETTSTPDADLTGLWTVIADGFSPPRTLACTEGHSGMSSMSLCSPFDLDLQVNGAAYTGTSSQTYCGADISAAVFVTGSGFSGEIVADDGNIVERFTVSGTVAGNTALIEPGNFTVDGVSGFCTTSGFFNAAR